jgi:hypothetical protein
MIFFSACMILSFISCTTNSLPKSHTTVIEAITQSAQSSGQQLVGPINLLATQSISDGVLTVSKYETQQQAVYCTHVAANVQSQWHARDSFCINQPLGAPPPRIEPLGIRPISTGKAPIIVYTAGLVGDPAIQQIILNFETAPPQTVPVQDGAYIAVLDATNNTTLRKIDGVDAQGNVVHTKSTP